MNREEHLMKLYNTFFNLLSERHPGFGERRIAPLAMQMLTAYCIQGVEGSVDTAYDYSVPVARVPKIPNANQTKIVNLSSPTPEGDAS